MIVLDLTCIAGHRFEGWFASTPAFEEQLRCGLVTCPHCESAAVSRLPSGPRVTRHTAVPAAPSAEQILGALQALLESSEDVGRGFAEEARRIHFREAPSRRIRGVATLDETAELLDEGIAVLPLPIPPKDETH